MELYYGDILRQIYITADLFMTDPLRQVYYGKYIMADIFRTAKTGISRQHSSAEALDCCIRTCLLQRIAPGTQLGEAALGPCGPPWALVAQALVASLGHCGPPGPLWTGPVLAGPL